MQDHHNIRIYITSLIAYTYINSLQIHFTFIIKNKFKLKKSLLSFMNFLLIIFFTCLKLSETFNNIFHHSRTAHKQKSIYLFENALESFIGNLGANVVPAAVAIYILSTQDKNLKEALSTQDKNQKESLASLEKTLATQDKNLKESLAFQDKNQKESLALSEKNIKTYLEIQGELWDARFEKVFENTKK